MNVTYFTLPNPALAASCKHNSAARGRQRTTVALMWYAKVKTQPQTNRDAHRLKVISNNNSRYAIKIGEETMPEVQAVVRRCLILHHTMIPERLLIETNDIRNMSLTKLVTFPATLLDQIHSVSLI